ncbi:MAG: hypothetical protein BWY71_02346 [Planctomycetes bacterium ADurb.Bin412]|nr:MAG: hypothetical protein BWY71_02346 [Planctomycetes bacterium ADurb.Bin412]
MQKIIRAEQVVLHRALWLEKYRDGEKIFDFSPVYLAEGRHKNTIRNICYDFFAAHWPGIHILDLSQEGFLCDAGHTWGLRPSHFEPSYYWRAANLIRRIAGIAEQPG